MNFHKSFDAEQMQYLELMCRLHSITKKYLLIAEEVAEDGELFLQPLKEHRDAYDHLIRCYSVNLIKNDMSYQDKCSYELENIKKAFGHEYRAFFDTADWLTYMLRKWIRIRLTELGEEKCKKLFDDYDEIKYFINQIPEEVAKLRASKDIGHFGTLTYKSSLIDEIEKYIGILDKLILLKIQISDKVRV